ncbi:hypothetical protein HYS31_01480 [Candidatus Woesearchaeota archaeon]|nr:hypothetical protein [Candidatus Woesearchaeota archaeon]
MIDTEVIDYSAKLPQAGLSAAFLNLGKDRPIAVYALRLEEGWPRRVQNDVLAVYASVSKRPPVTALYEIFLRQADGGAVRLTSNGWGYESDRQIRWLLRNLFGLNVGLKSEGKIDELEASAVMPLHKPLELERIAVSNAPSISEHHAPQLVEPVLGMWVLQESGSAPLAAKAQYSR